MDASQIVLFLFMLSVLYPLCVIPALPFPNQKFVHKAHIAFFNMLAGIAVVSLLFLNLSISMKVSVLAWKAFLVFISRKYWKAPALSTKYLWIPVLVGFLLIYVAARDLHAFNLKTAILAVLLCAILCFLIFAGINRLYHLRVRRQS